MDGVARLLASSYLLLTVALMLTRDRVLAICPSRCVCDDDALRVECVGGDLDIVPITLNPQLRQLVLRSNRIRSASADESFTFYTDLQELDLSRNFLDSLESGTLQHQANLVRLDVSHNRISLIENRTFAVSRSIHTIQF
jgi:Leucine-rich repeat (LRR) protein